MSKERNQVQFYADSWIHKNKLYTYWVNNERDAINCLLRFQRRGYVIRSAFYHSYNRMKVRTGNKRIL